MNDADVTHIDMRTPGEIPAVRTEGRLVVLAGAMVGRVFPTGDAVVLGRSAGVDIQIDDPVASRRHARIRRIQDGKYIVEDLGSRNGTLVNGSNIDTHELRFGDRIQIGRQLFLFTHHDPLEEQVLQRQKLEAIGRLGTGIAHDFNNLLGAVISSMDVLDDLDAATRLDDTVVRECLDDIRTAAKRAAEMSRRLLGFARRGQTLYGPVDIGNLCTEVVHLARRIFDRTIRIESSTRSGLVIRGDRVRLHQLLMNLCINARDAMPSGGRLSVETRPATLDDLRRSAIDPGSPHVLLVIRDTGIGMDEETRKHAFDPFFTTKGGDRGAGLGLATVRDVATAHGGVVEVDSKPNEGTCFRVLLPVGAVSPDEQDATEGIGLSTDSNEEVSSPLRILLVDDEDVVRRSAGRVLRQAGHDVSVASDGEEAVSLYRASTQRPDIVLLDLDMPNLGGQDTFRRLREVDPRAAVLFVSGFWEPEVEERLRHEGALGFLQKPYRAATLRLAIQDAIGKRAQHDTVPP